MEIGGRQDVGKNGEKRKKQPYPEEKGVIICVCQKKAVPLHPISKGDFPEEVFLFSPEAGRKSRFYYFK